MIAVGMVEMIAENLGTTDKIIASNAAILTTFGS